MAPPLRTLPSPPHHLLFPPLGFFLVPSLACIPIPSDSGSSLSSSPPESIPRSPPHPSCPKQITVESGGIPSVGGKSRIGLHRKGLEAEAMAVIPLESLPLGFRFRPTDEELINHYLKNKNNGRVHDVEVIPEVDVCKCEPWDLPEKSLIPTGDPEWFFYAPRDRKYPNGHRSNRATEAGYWKATGKDRTIKSRSVGGTTPIGMKKTLVFYRGRAPRGERTSWIMHEYRVTGLASENDDDRANGYQGAYVLCRLFKKPEERTSNPNCDEVEDSGFFHTPARSSPYDAPHAEDAVEDSQTPSNQEISESDAQEDPHIFLANIQKQSDGINRSFADEVHSRTKHLGEPEESKFYGNTVSKYDEGEVEPEMDPLMEAVNRLCGTQPEPTDIDDFPRIDSPIYMDDIFSDISHIYHLKLQGVDIDLQDSMSEYLGPVLNQDEYSLGGSYNQGSIANPHSVNMSLSVHHCDVASGKDSGSSSDADTELGMQQVQKKHLDTDILELLDTESCSSQNLTNPVNVNPVANYPLGNIYGSGHANQIVCDHARMEVSSLGSITESPQDAYSVSIFGVSTNQSTLVSENNGLGGTGIAIRSRQLQYPVGAPTSLQGTATRRLRLQKNFHKESSSSSTGVDSSLEDDEVRSANFEERQDVQEPSKQHVCKEEEPSQPASIHKTETPNPDETPLVQVAPGTPNPIDESKGSNPAGLRLTKLNDIEGYDGGGRSAPLNLTPELPPPTLPRVTFVTLALTFLVALVGVAWKCLKD